MSREMLGDGHETRRKHRLDERHAERGDGVWSRAEGAVTDHRVRRIEEAIEHGRQAGVEPGGAQLARHRSRHRRGQTRIAAASDGGRGGEPRERRRQAVDAAALVVHHHEEIGIEPPGLCGQRKHRLEARAIAREQHDAAQPGVLRQRRDISGASGETPRFAGTYFATEDDLGLVVEIGHAPAGFAMPPPERVYP